MFTDQELHQLEPRLAAAFIGINVPLPVDSIVIVAERVGLRMAFHSQAGKGEIGSAIFRFALPQAEEIGLGFVEPPGVAQRARQIQLVVRIFGPIGKRGMKKRDRPVGVARLQFGFTFFKLGAGEVMQSAMKYLDKLGNTDPSDNGQRQQQKDDSGRAERD